MFREMQNIPYVCMYVWFMREVVWGLLSVFDAALRF